MSLLWIMVYTMPRLDNMIHISPSVTMASVWTMYAVVTVSNAMHSWNYYELIERTGNVRYGQLQKIK